MEYETKKITPASLPIQPETPPVPQTPPAPRFTFLKNRKFLMIGAVVLVFLLLAGAGGYLYLQNQIATTPPPGGGPEPTATPDPTAGWETYSSLSLGISFKYPEGWFKSVEDSDQISFIESSPMSPTISRGFSVLRYPNDENLDIRSWWKGTASSGDSEPILEDITINSQPALKQTINDSPIKEMNTTVIFIAHNKYVYGLSGQVGQSIYDQILSTFKFTDSSTAGWKTFSNTTYKLTFSYPDNESFEGIPSEDETGTTFIFGEIATIHFTVNPKNLDSSVDSFNGKPSNGTRVINSVTWYKFAFPNGYNENITTPTYVLRTEKDSYIYTAEFRNRLELNSEDEIFLNSIRFD